MKNTLSIENIKHHLVSEYPLHIFDCVDSTNTVAAEMASNGARHGTVIFARRQTKGRGRLGRSFASPDSSGIYMSVILEHSSGNPVLITTAAAVAVCKAIEKVCNHEPLIKWVNDIYLDDKKVCGILAEAVTNHKSGAITHIILGIGINLNDAALPPELKEIAGAINGEFSADQLAAEVINQLMSLTDGTDFIREYKERSMVIGREILVYKGGFSPEVAGTAAHALDIDENGGLIVLFNDGHKEVLSTGEISIRF